MALFNRPITRSHCAVLPMHSNLNFAVLSTRPFYMKRFVSRGPLNTRWRSSQLALLHQHVRHSWSSQHTIEFLSICSFFSNMVEHVRLSWSSQHTIAVLSTRSFASNTYVTCGPLNTRFHCSIITNTRFPWHFQRTSLHSQC